MIEIKLSEQLLRLEDVHTAMNDITCGATNIFVGTVKNQNHGKKVLKVEYEAKDNSAHTELYQVAQLAASNWPVRNLIIQHRLGVVEIGDISLIIAATTTEPGDAFEVCRFLVEEIRKCTSIWKKEMYEKGEIRVTTHP